MKNLIQIIKNIQKIRLLKLISIAIIMLIVSCVDNSEDITSIKCGDIESLEKMPWFKSRFESIKNIPQSAVILYRYNSEEVIEFQSSLMSSTNQSQYFCNGTRLVLDDPLVYQEFLKNRTKVKELFGVSLWGL
ncbi:hypothetical protein [Mongoliitalea daihaiensis]|uniref:hypothetical protein n=1 Tax=Mongoliitalea daihaiensis TaxID=2782006 RepID=UPI001F3440AD|nr:hypothetical protein [Mongoliitalea daihaiensis]UJP65844.1 hypothetical protein IPZ59_04255 [Mongoliitalea daihaiensis]